MNNTSLLINLFSSKVPSMKESTIYHELTVDKITILYISLTQLFINN